MGSVSIMYRLLDYLRGTETDRINIARCAYLLGRMAPSANAREEEKANIVKSHHLSISGFYQVKTG